MKKLFIICSLLIFLLSIGGCSKTDYNLFGSIHGTVTDQVSGEPIVSASIVLAPGGKTQVTGTDGSFEFVNLDAGQYTVTVQKAEYSTNRKTVTVYSDETTEANIPLTKIN